MQEKDPFIDKLLSQAEKANQRLISVCSKKTGDLHNSKATSLVQDRVGYANVIFPDEVEDSMATRVGAGCRRHDGVKIAFVCGYRKISTLIAEKVLSDFSIRTFAEGLDMGCKTRPRTQDILVIGMFGGKCSWNDFPGKVLFVNGEAEGRLPIGTYGVGPYDDSSSTVKLYFVTLAAFRIPHQFLHGDKHVITSKRREKFVLYVSNKCKRHREAAFDDLAKIGQVWSGGKCKGSGHGFHLQLPPRKDGWESSISFYHDFRFALVMENTKHRGYITEKILIAFAAGAIPIYYGTEEVFKIFNHAAFIYFDINNSTPALEMIEYLESNRSEYDRMLEQPILKNDMVLAEYFSLDMTVGN